MIRHKAHPSAESQTRSGCPRMDIRRALGAGLDSMYAPATSEPVSDREQRERYERPTQRDPPHRVPLTLRYVRRMAITE